MNRLLPQKASGYHQVGEQSAQTTGLKDKDLEMNEVGAGLDLGSDAFYDEVSSIRDAVRLFEASIQDLTTKQAFSLSNPSPELTNQVDGLTLSLTSTTSSLTQRIASLSPKVGKDEARRGHWETLKGSLGRAVSKLQMVEKAHREKIRERVARQFRIVKPEATESEVQQVLEAGNGGQIFAQAVASSRSEDATAALSEAKDRRSEILKLEANLIELATLFQQVQGLVAEQDQQFISIEESAYKTEEDMSAGVKQLGTAKISAAAARHKRVLCAAFAGVIVLVIVIVVVVQIKSNSNGPPSSTDTPTEPAADPAAAPVADPAAAAVAAVARLVRW